MCGRFFVEGESDNELLARMIAEAERKQQAITGESSIARGEVFPASTVAAMATGKSGEIGMFPMGAFICSPTASSSSTPAAKRQWINPCSDNPCWNAGA